MHFEAAPIIAINHKTDPHLKLELAEQLELLCVAVMRRYPDLNAVHGSYATTQRTGTADGSFASGGFYPRVPSFLLSCYRANPEVIALVLKRLSDCGHVPEALRIAHLITPAVVKGESGRQAYRT